MELRRGQPDWSPADPKAAEAAREKGRQLSTMGTVICGSSVAVFLPALLMMQRRGTNPVILYILLAFWLMDLVFGITFIVRGRKLMQQGSEKNG